MLIMNNQSLGNIIKSARLEKNLTQDELAFRIHVDRSLVSKYERDKAVPPKCTLKAICEVLDLEYKALSKNNFDKVKIGENILAAALTSDILLILVLVVPFLRYSGYPLPDSTTPQVVYSSFLSISVLVHSPFSLICVITLSAHAIISLILLFINRKSSKVERLSYLIFSSVSHLFFLITLIDSLLIYINNFAH